MSIKFNEHNHPTLELDGGFHVCLHRAVYDEDLQLRTSASEDLSEETAKALADLRRLVTATPNLNFPLELSTNWMVPVYLRCCENDAKRAFDILDYSYRLLYRENEFTKSYAQIRHVFELGLMRYLPECTDDGAVIAVIQMGQVVPRNGRNRINQAGRIEIHVITIGVDARDGICIKVKRGKDEIVL
ncbi:hypothetical protein quinque_001106 [Culex quinquefasciatus]